MSTSRKSIVREVEYPTDDNCGLPSTWILCLWRFDRQLFLASAFMQFAWSSCTITAAYYFVKRMTVNKDKAEGLKLCFGYLGTVIAMSISYQLKVLWSGKMGARLKQRLAAKISEHALLKGLTSASDKAAAVVLASQDTHNICEGAICLWQLPASICEGSVITALVIETSGALGGGIAAAILIAGFIALFCMSLRMTSLKHEMSCAQDRQVSLFYEVISNIRPFRLYGWDVFFLDRLNKLTEQLAPIQRKIMVLKALNVSTVIIFPCFVSLIVFIVHFTETGMFNSTVFQNTLLSLLNTFRYPLLNLPSSLRSIAAANNSYRRVLEYFRRPIAVDQRAAADEAGAVEIDDLPIGPNGSMLKQLRVKPGSLFVLQGPVKSYKSTVINTLAGHVKIPTTASVRIGGSISYAPQLPWMCQTTIQDNIISSEAFDEKRYEQVLQACALTQDLAIMPLGDQTPVAEKGISLSGGQRQRVALARAAYKNADIYLLDNPISALDDATQEHIWSQLIEGLLKDATVIVSSSRSVPSCSMILHLNPKGLEGDIQQVNGWTVAPAAAQPPPRYVRHTPSVHRSEIPRLSVSNRNSVDVRSCQSSLGKTLEDHALQDVEEEAGLFANYAKAKETEKSSLFANGMRPVAEVSSHGSELQQLQVPGACSDVPEAASSSFLDSLEQQRKERGTVSAFSPIGSRRVSFTTITESLDAGKEHTISNCKTDDGDVAVDIANCDNIQEKSSAFFCWIRFCGLNIPFFVVLALLYVVFPGPRIWYDQWTGFWAAKKYSRDDQFNINILAITFLVVVLLRIITDLMVFYLAARSEQNMRRSLCRTVVNAPMTFFMTENMGPLIGLFSRDLAIIGDELMQDLHMGALYMIFNIASTVFVCVFFPYFAIPGFLIFALLFCVQKVYSKKMALIRNEFQAAQDSVHRTLFDCLEGVQIIRTARSEQWAVGLLGETLTNNGIATIAVEKANIWLSHRADSLAVALCFFMVLFVNQFEVSETAKGLIIGNSLPILVLFTWSMKLLGNAQFLLNSVSRVQSYVDTVIPETKDGDALSIEFPKSGGIEFRNVSLRYGPGLPCALDNVSFKLPHAAKVGVVGRTGSGKSTLLVALFRLVQPCSGTMIVDSKPVNTAAVDVLRRQLAIIPQDPAMFEGSLRTNLDPFDEYTDQQIRSVIYEVGLSESRDMYSAVGVAGEDWSVGEKQLKPKVLCLDEATASLDAKTEAQFQKVLETSFEDTTIICIAHRIDTLRWCRTRIEMQQGKLVGITAVEAP